MSVLAPATLITHKTWSNQIHQPPTLDEKIRIVEERVLGWQLDVANNLVNTRYPDGSQVIPNCGFAALAVVLSYFEMIAEYSQGESSEGQSELFFRRGVQLVFPSLVVSHPNAVDILDKLYNATRCGLYHSGSAKRGVWLDGRFPKALDFDPRTQKLLINPHVFVPELVAHFKSYIAQLRDPSNVILRRNFNLVFDL